MNLDRIEELLLALIAVLILTYLAPLSLDGAVIVTLLIAIALIALLIMRSVSWHHDGITPYDGILVIGVAITIAYMASFAAFTRTALNTIVLLLFACFYGLMAVVLFQHRSTRSTHPTHLRAWRVRRTTTRVENTPAFRRGIQPIAERNPPWERKRVAVASHTAHDAHVMPLKEAAPPWEKGIKWYHRFTKPTAYRAHKAAQMSPLKESAPPWEKPSRFHADMEPIHEITPEHLHRLGVYDTEPRRKRT